MTPKSGNQSSDKAARDATAADNKVTRLRPTRPCPICSKPSAQQFHPFCSARCADIDLNRWLSGAYVIPVRDDEEEDEAGLPETDEGEA